MTRGVQRSPPSVLCIPDAQQAGSGANCEIWARQLLDALSDSSGEQRVPGSRHSLALKVQTPRANWPLRIRVRSSTPAIVVAAWSKSLKPKIGLSRSFTPRWSCSIMLLRYFEDRTFLPCQTRISCGISRIARCALPRGQATPRPSTIQAPGSTVAFPDRLRTTETGARTSTDDQATV
jgi:hypothetical protein